MGPAVENQMKRRAFVAMLVLASFMPAPPGKAADAPTVGLLYHGRGSAAAPQAFEAALAELGWRDGVNVRIVRRPSDGDPTRLARGAEELVALNPQVIFAGFTPAVIALQRHTSKIPVVFAGVSDPVEIGAAGQLARPDRNFTGVTTMNRELMPKRLALLSEALLHLSVVGYLANPLYALHKPQLQEMQEAASRLGMTLVVAEVSNAPGLDAAFAQLAAHRVQAIVVQQDPLFSGEHRRVIALAEANRLPAIYPTRAYFDAGGLMWYGADLVGLFRRAAAYVDRILKGAKPSELAIERPAKFDLAVNLKLARQLGIAINPTFVTRADEVLE